MTEVEDHDRGLGKECEIETETATERGKGAKSVADPGSEKEGAI